MTGIQMRKKRIRLGLTQQELARKLYYETYHSICHMEAGRRKIPRWVDDAMKLMKLTN